MRFDKNFVTAVLPDVLIPFGHFPEEATFSIDSRKVQKGDIFVALPGEHVDGHNYVISALKKGAAGAIIATGREHELLSSADKKSWQNAFIALDKELCDTKYAVQAY